MRMVMVAGALLAVSGAWAGDDKSELTKGQAIYSQTCIACHGVDGRGAFPGVADLTTADGPLAKSDEALIKNISEGFQSPKSALSMPANGGNPAMTQADVIAVLAYLRATFGS